MRLRLDSRRGTLRWRTPEGKVRTVNDRLYAMPARVAQQTAQGTGTDFRIKIDEGKRWWRCPLTMTEARTILALEPGTTAILLRADLIRADRLERGLPLFEVAA